jgi:hypothetical protein
VGRREGGREEKGREGNGNRERREERGGMRTHYERELL